MPYVRDASGDQLKAILVATEGLVNDTTKLVQSGVNAVADDATFPASAVAHGTAAQVSSSKSQAVLNQRCQRLGIVQNNIVIPAWTDAGITTPPITTVNVGDDAIFSGLVPAVTAANFVVFTMPLPTDPAFSRFSQLRIQATYLFPDGVTTVQGDLLSFSSISQGAYIASGDLLTNAHRFLLAGALTDTSTNILALTASVVASLRLFSFTVGYTAANALNVAGALSVTYFAENFE